MVIRKSYIILVYLAGVLLLTGCLKQQTPVEKMYKVLENVVASEEAFEAQQDPLVELEKKEKEIYDKIISLGMKEFEEVTKLSNEASEIVDQRKTHIEKEEESIKASEKEFKALKPIIEDLKNPALKEKSLQLYEIMIERYKIHSELYLYYSKAIELDRELYAMFKNENIQLDQLEDQITKINEIYGKVLEANEKFNEKTKRYNDMKLSLYKESGLEVKVKE
ncbi:YkyA family protein [Bacillus sp. FJAT-49705]|uniref:YkyA family protein n=1 Tax=Cytobacillus citreus TaxID=2833586 RepID=A0ABS5NMH9_9BACI|nr:YkyA family protein [Cytobacillus citreus]MBS4189054.1 YkyA family protein [Cytobacillus citreus]